MDGYIKIGTEIDATSFDAQIEYIEAQLEEIEHKIKQADMGFEVGDTQKLEAQYEKLINQLTKLRKKQADLGKVDFSGVKKSVDKIGDSVSNVLKKISKWALAIVGIRTAYNAIRKAISMVSEVNDDVATQIDTMSYSVAYTLAPFVEKLMYYFARIMVYVNYIAKALTGKYIFDFNKAFEKVEENANKTNKKVKEITKQLAGFDEMNVLSDTSAKETQGGTSGTLAGAKVENPFKDWENWEIPEWVDTLSKWLTQVKDVVVNDIIPAVEWLIDNVGLIDIAGLIALLSILIGLITGNWGAVLTGIITFVILALPQIKTAIEDIIAFVIWLWDELKAFRTWMFSGFLAKWTTIGGLLLAPFTNAYQNIKARIDAIKLIFEGAVGVIKGLLKGDLKGAFNSFSTFLKGWGSLIGNFLVAPFNLLIDAINAVIRGINTIKVEIPNWDIFGKLKGKTFGFDFETLDRIELAKGGIINNPGRGVPLTSNVVGGEVSREGVIPLTDSQMMEELGATIGRYITINANITNTMNGRVISRELKKIQNADDFAFNG